MSEIKEKYKYHEANEDQQSRYQKLRESFSDLENLISDLCSNGREKSLAITNLEQAAMWANKAIAMEEIKE